MRNIYNRRLLINLSFFILAISSITYYAYQTGITGRTRKTANNGCYCHGVEPFGAVVSINGPDTLQVGQTANFTLVITGGPLAAGGTNIAAKSGSLNTTDATLQKLNGELTHVSPLAAASGKVTFTFSYTAPAFEVKDTIFANGNSVNLSATPSGDNWNFAPAKAITILNAVPVELTSFTATITDNNISLNWITTTEVNNQGFEVQRTDGKYKTPEEKQWLTVAYINGKGNSLEVNKYNFEDRNLTNGTYSYRIKQIDFEGTYKFYYLTKEVVLNSPSLFALSQNYPNPFNPETKINFSLPSVSYVSLKIYNSLGQEIKDLLNGQKEAGNFDVSFNAMDLPSGLYFYSLKAKETQSGKEYNETRKMILLR